MQPTSNEITIETEDRNPPRNRSISPPTLVSYSEHIVNSSFCISMLGSRTPKTTFGADSLRRAAPRAAKASPVAQPIPLLAPVIRATFSFISDILVLQCRLARLQRTGLYKAILPAHQTSALWSAYPRNNRSNWEAGRIRIASSLLTIRPEPRISLVGGPCQRAFLQTLATSERERRWCKRLFHRL